MYVVRFVRTSFRIGSKALLIAASHSLTRFLFYCDCCVCLQMSSTNQNTSFASASRVTNESSVCGAAAAAAAATATATTFTTTSSSSSHQRLHRQITREMKTSCVKSDLSELKSSFSEVKNLTTYASAFENMLDPAKEEVTGVPTADGGVAAGSGEPVITYPDSPTPTSGSGILIFPAGGSRKNSLATTEEVMQCSSPAVGISTNELNFEQKRSLSAASRTKMITQQFKTQESVIGNATTEKSIDARHVSER